MIGLCVAATASPVRLIEHEILCWNRAAGWVQRQRVNHVVTEGERRGLHEVGGSSLGKVRKQGEVAVWICVAVDERQVVAVYLSASNHKTD